MTSSASPAASSSPTDPRPDVCSLCGAALAEDDRCRGCGMHQAGPGRPSPFHGASLWLLAGAIATVYVVALVLVAAAR